MQETLNFLANSPGWAWLTAAALLVFLDIAAPGLFLIWFGAAAGFTGLLTFATGVGWTWQFAAFSVAAVAALFVGRRFFSPGRIKTDRPLLNRRGQQLVGQTFTLAEAMRSGRGRVQIGDTLWLASGPDLEAGAKVTVIAADGARLIVEAAPAPVFPKAGSFSG